MKINMVFSEDFLAAVNFWDPLGPPVKSYDFFWGDIFCKIIFPTPKFFWEIWGTTPVIFPDKFLVPRTRCFGSWKYEFFGSWLIKTQVELLSDTPGAPTMLSLTRIEKILLHQFDNVMHRRYACNSNCKGRKIVMLTVIGNVTAHCCVGLEPRWQRLQ